MIRLKGSRGVFLINPLAIELVEIELDTTVILTANGRISVPTEENLDALQRLSTEPLVADELPQVYPF
ncbi:MAG: hypothetical protein LH606_02420 [Cytophagaceae bacterium]|nr:hypothetical protein [Cytophagaceae bacterium]